MSVKKVTKEEPTCTLTLDDVLSTKQKAKLLSEAKSALYNSFSDELQNSIEKELLPLTKALFLEMKPVLTEIIKDRILDRAKKMRIKIGDDW